MEKQYYLLHLLPCRPDFAVTMTDDEKATMKLHVAHWTDLMNKGKVLVFGPVIDPKAIYGLGIVSVDNEEELKTFITNDPAAKINKYEYYPMRAVVPDKK
jgi:uncharacterized protein YciI